MKIAFTPSIGFILDFECQVDCAVEWDKGTPKLRVDDVYDSTGQVSIIRSTDDTFWREFAGRIADEAEKCPRLLARAVERDVFEREAA